MNKIYSKRRARKKCHRQFWPTWSSQFAPCPNQEIHLKFELNQSRLQWRSGPTRMKKALRCHPTKGLHNPEGQIWSTLESSLPWTKTIGRERQWLTKQPARQKQNVFLFIHSLKSATCLVMVGSFWLSFGQVTAKFGPRSGIPLGGGGLCAMPRVTKRPK